MISARKYHDVGVAELLALLIERVSADEASVRFPSLVDSRPQILCVATNACKRIHDPALAQVQLWIETLVQFLSSLLDSAEVYFDLLPVHDGHVVLSRQ